MKNISLKVWLEGTIVAALAIVLSLLPTNIGTGFTVSLGMIPLTVYALRRGLTAGVLSGFMWGILHFLIGNAYILTLLQGFIEYFIAFAFVGFAGFFSKKMRTSKQEGSKKRQITYLVAATIVGTFARFFWHFVAGYYYWGSYAPEGMSPLLYSFIMNGGSALATAAVTIIVLVLLNRTSPSLFVPKEEYARY